MGKSSSPAAPDPYQSAAAQYEYGTAAGNYSTALGDVNQVSPYGSTTYTVNPDGMSTTPAGTSNTGGAGNIDTAYNPWTQYGSGVDAGPQMNPSEGGGSPALYPSSTGDGWSGGFTGTPGGTSTKDGAGATTQPAPYPQAPGQTTTYPQPVSTGAGPQLREQTQAPGQTTNTPPAVTPAEGAAGQGNSGGMYGAAATNAGTAQTPTGSGGNYISIPGLGEIPTNPAGVVPGSGGGNNSEGTFLPANSSGTQYIQEPNAPQYTETQTLSPQEQAIFNATTANQAGTQQIGNAALPGVAKSVLSTPNLQTSVTPAQMVNQQGFDTALQGNLAAITPQLSNEYEQLDSSLRNSGATPGTPAYDNAMAQFQASQGGELDQAAGAAENTGATLAANQFGENLEGAQFGNSATVQQNQLPLQNFETLMASGGGTGGTGVTLPGSSTSSGANVQAPDIMSAFQQAYQGQLAQYNANVASSNATEGDITSLLGSAAMYAALSA